MSDLAFPHFPPRFAWSVATAANQILAENGRGEPIWDRLCHVATTVRPSSSRTAKVSDLLEVPEGENVVPFVKHKPGPRKPARHRTPHHRKQQRSSLWRLL
ncbi:MAG: family 1 glycosylhydrolase [Streptosporangiaceae bacterium]